MTPHATAMLHQPKVPSTGQRQTTELHIKWKEVLDQKKSMLKILAETTGQTAEKIDKTSGFISKTGEDSNLRKATYEESIGWYSGITSDMFS